MVLVAEGIKEGRHQMKKEERQITLWNHEAHHGDQWFQSRIQSHSVPSTAAVRYSVNRIMLNS